MGKMFNYDSLFMKFMSRMWDIIWLNVLFILCSVPIFTAGASYTALNTVLLAIIRKEEGYITKSFLIAFKNNFKKVTPVWIGMLTAYWVLIFDICILIKSMNSGKGLIIGILCAALFLVVCTNIYTFALYARFENSLKNTLKNAFLLSLSQFFITITMIADIIIPFALTYYNTYFVPVVLLFGFSGPAFINAFYFNRLFYKIEKNKKFKEVLFLQPVFMEFTWGGNRLNTEFGYQIPSDTTGEAWVISAHKEGSCIITGGEYNGRTLDSLFESNRELFGDIGGDRFPLQVRIIDAKKDTDPQVHPDDYYAAKYENGSMGGAKCWFILDCGEGAVAVIGHNAKTKDEMKQMMDEGKWPEFLREIPIKKGDFFQIDPGCLHAVKGGTMLLEIRQNSNVTYCIQKKGLEVIQFPYVPSHGQKKIEKGKEFYKETFIENDHYCVCRLTVDGEVNLKQDSPFVNVNVICGSGRINDTQIRKGDNFIIPAGFGKYRINGKLSLVMSSVR